MTISIDVLTQNNADQFQGLIDDMHLDKDDGYVDRSVDKSVDGRRITLLAFVDNVIAGFCLLNFEPAYRPFQTLGIPEMQDLNTHPDYRQQGVATTLINECEECVRDVGASELGLGVGLHAGYGNAHRLYAKVGFVPDGQGIVYDAKGVQPLDIRPVDDELCMMMTKTL